MSRLGLLDDRFAVRPVDVRVGPGALWRSEGSAPPRIVGPRRQDISTSRRASRRRSRRVPPGKRARPTSVGRCRCPKASGRCPSANRSHRSFTAASSATATRSRKSPSPAFLATTSPETSIGRRLQPPGGPPCSRRTGTGSTAGSPRSNAQRPRKTSPRAANGRWREPTYPLQARCATLARLGFVVFMYDMVGYADSGPIRHREGFTDAQAELRLQSFMGLQTWNSLRALDFLAALPDVDPDADRVTGESGGGTQTFLVTALDPRPVAAVPAVMVSGNMQGGCICENASLLADRDEQHRARRALRAEAARPASARTTGRMMSRSGVCPSSRRFTGCTTRPTASTRSSSRSRTTTTR